MGEKVIYYTLQRRIRGIGWVEEGPVYETKEEADKELKWYQKRYPNERWGIAKETATIIFKNED